MIKSNLFFILFLFLFTFNFNVNAQNPKRASLEVMLSDESPMQIIINGRIYKQVNKKLIINDLPAKTNEIIILKKCNLAQNKNCKDITVFSGNVKFEKGKHYQAVALVGEEKLRVTDDGTLFTPVITTEKVGNTPSYASTEFQKLAEIKSNLPEDIKTIEEDLKKIKKDDERVQKAIHFISNRNPNITVEQLWGLSSWIMYDSNKLALFKQSYPYLADPQNINQLSAAFTMVEEREAFEQFLQEK